MPSPLTWSILTAGLALFLAGAALLRRGAWPKRTGDTPHCPACDYVLRGLGSNRCPECGGDVASHQIVRGERHRRPKAAWLGGLCTLLGSTVLLLTASGTLQRVDWYHYRPTSWVLRDADHFVSGRRAWDELQRRSAAGTLSTEQQAQWERIMLNRAPRGTSREWTELASRASAGKLAAENRSAWARHLFAELENGSYPEHKYHRGHFVQVWTEITRLLSTNQLSTTDRDELVDVGFRGQAKPYPTPAFHVIDWTYQQYLAHVLTPDQERRFIQNLRSPRLDVRPRAGPADPIPFRLVVSGWGPIFSTSDVHLDSVRVDSADADERMTGDEADEPKDSPVLPIWLGPFDDRINPRLIEGRIKPQPLGHHTLRIRVSSTIRLPPPSPGSVAPPPVTRTDELTAAFDVTADGSPKPVHRPDAATLAQLFQVPVQLQAGQGKLGGLLWYGTLPVNFAFSLFVRIDGVEYPMESIVEAAGGGRHGIWHEVANPPAAVPATVDLILRGNPDLARRTLDLFDYWDGEIVFHDVPVQGGGSAKPAK